MTYSEIDIIGKKYYLYIDTSTFIGKIERLVTDIFKKFIDINSYKHGKNGIFLNSNNNQPLFLDSPLKITWKYDKCNKNKLQYDFYLKFFNKYTHLGKSRYDKLYIDKDSNIRGKGYVFNKHMFDFYLYTKPKP